MSKLPLLNAREMAKILSKLGFELKRQEGSHMLVVWISRKHRKQSISTGLQNPLNFNIR